MKRYEKTCLRSSAQPKSVLFSYRSNQNVIALLKAHVDWLEDEYLYVKEKSNPISGLEELWGWCEGKLKFYLIDFVEIPLTNYPKIIDYVDGSGCLVVGCKIGFKTVAEMDVELVDEFFILHLLDILKVENRIEFSENIPKKPLENPLFTKCLGLALTHFGQALQQTRHHMILHNTSILDSYGE